jgi:heme-degrading monooxygenase HmoA
MVITVFRSKLRTDNTEEFQRLVDRMMEIATSMPGFVSYKVYRADDGERCSIIEFDTAEHLLAWRNHPEHVEAQKLGRQRYYQEYSLVVAEPSRESRFERDAAPA